MFPFVLVSEKNEKKKKTADRFEKENEFFGGRYCKWSGFPLIIIFYDQFN